MFEGFWWRPDPDDVDIKRTKWNPTPEQFRAYQAREVEMARALLRDRPLGRARRNVADTLFSTRTLLAALATGAS